MAEIPVEAEAYQQYPAKGAQRLPPIFGPCLLWPRSPISATAELL